MMLSLMGNVTCRYEHDSILANCSSLSMKMRVLESSGSNCSSSLMYYSFRMYEFYYTIFHLYMNCTSPSALKS